MLKERLRKCIDSGVSLFIGTADGDGKPSCCRAVGLHSTDDFETVTVYAPVATAQETIANLATTRRIAIGMSHPPDHSSLQIKGLLRAVRLARADEAALVEQQMEQYAAILAEIGLPRHMTRRVNHWPAFAVDVTGEQVFDQTPGPKAGLALH
jgi:hypothetical protein